MSFGSGPRCPSCAARALSRTDRVLRYEDGTRRSFAFACASCGLLTDGDLDAADRVLAGLSAGPYVASPDDPFGLDLYTLRSAALGRNLLAVPADGIQADSLRAPHSERAAAATLLPLSDGPRQAISLGILCTAAEAEGVLGSLAPYAAFASDVTILADGTALAPAVVEADGFDAGRVRLARRTLAGNFAAQRNALQAMAREDWMLQLDSDESLAPALARRLPSIAGLAQADAMVSVGLTRRNLVDGILSDVFPDVQYRLNRREVRYAGLVHERPDRAWHRSLLVPGEGIDHHLARGRVLSRSRAYEALAPGRGRLAEAEDLLKPYRD